MQRGSAFCDCQITAVYHLTIYHLTIFTFTFSDYVHIYLSTAAFTVRFRRINISLDHSKHQHHHRYMATPAPSILVMFACFRFAPLNRVIPTELRHVTINTIHNYSLWKSSFVCVFTVYHYDRDAFSQVTQGRLYPQRPCCVPPKMTGWVPQFLIITHLKCCADRWHDLCVLCRRPWGDLLLTVVYCCDLLPLFLSHSALFLFRFVMYCSITALPVAFYRACGDDTVRYKFVKTVNFCGFRWASTSPITVFINVVFTFIFDVFYNGRVMNDLEQRNGHCIALFNVNWPRSNTTTSICGGIYAPVYCIL